MTFNKTPNLLPFFTKKIGATLYQGKAEKMIARELFGPQGKTIRTKPYTRNFKLLVIAVDEEGVWFEGWNYEGGTNHHRDERYSGTVYVPLEGMRSVIDTLNQASNNLPLELRN